MLLCRVFPSRSAAHIATAAACVLLGLSWQALVVNARYGGNWTALYCTGAENAPPTSLAAEHVYVFPHSSGYDGQFYHYVAHDPFFRTGLWRSTDLAPHRYHRILVPVLAYMLAFGAPNRIDPSYIATNLVFLFLGAWWLSRYLHLMKLPAGLAALLLLAPAMLISLDRLTIDSSFAALCIGFALYARRGENGKAWVVLILSCLCRETGFLLVFAASLALAMRRRYTYAALTLAAAIPACAWYLYVNSRVTWNQPYGAADFVPIVGILETFVRPFPYYVGTAAGVVLVSLDRLALLGFLAAAALAVWVIRRNGVGTIELAALLWSAVGLCLPRSFWEDAFAGPRVFTPVLLYVFLEAFPAIGWRAMVPLLLVVPRVLLQVAAPLLLAAGFHAPR